MNPPHPRIRAESATVQRRLEEVVTRPLIEALEAAFPDRLPESLLDPRQYDVKIGEQRVIRALKAALKRAEGQQPRER